MPPDQKETRREGRVQAVAPKLGGKKRQGAADSTDQRKRDLAMIHIAKAELQMADDVYRNVLWTIGRVESSAKLDHGGRQKLLEHFKACGWSGKGKDGRPVFHGRKPGNARLPDRAALLRKIEALLTEAGRPWPYADGLAKKMFGVELLTFTTPEQLHKIAAALTYDQKRRLKRKEEGNG